MWGSTGEVGPAPEYDRRKHSESDESVRLRIEIVNECIMKWKFGGVLLD